MKRKLNSLLLVLLGLALVLCLMPASALADGFSDVSESDWFAEPVQYAVDNGLMNGVGGDRFAPNDPTTRAMIVTILYRVEGEPVVEGEPPYSDTAARAWYIYPVMWAKDNDIVKGYEDGTFKPDAEITREQFATILYRYAQYKGYDVSVGEDTNILSFNDALQVSDWANAAVCWAVGAGLMNGDDKGNLLPQNSATRAQAAALFQRFLENMEPADPLLGDWYSEDFDGAFVYTFKADGTGNYDAAGTDMPFTYTAADGKLSIQYEDVDVPWETVYTIDGDKLTVKDDLGEDVVYTRTKPVNPLLGDWYSEDFDGAFVYTFKEDLTGNYAAAGTDMPFTYTTADGKLSIQYEDADVPWETVYSIDSDKLTVKDDLGEDVVYTKTKPENQLVGSWASDEYEGAYVYTFKADYTGSYDSNGTVTPFNYMTDKMDLYILSEGDDETIVTEYTIQGDTLGIKNSFLGENKSFHKK